MKRRSITTLRFVLFTACVIGVGAPSAIAQPQYSITDLGVLPGHDTSIGTRITESGAVLADSLLYEGPLPPQRAFVWQDGVRTDLGLLPGFANLKGAAVNEAGKVVGWASSCLDCTRAIEWTSGVLTDLGTVGFDNSMALSVNAGGQVAGLAWSALAGSRAITAIGGVASALPLLAGGTQSIAHDLNDAGQIVGAANVANPQEFHVVVWQNGAITDLGTMGGLSAVGQFINTSGDIAGRLYVQSGLGFRQHAFVYRDGIATDLGTFGGQNSHAAGLNEAGDVIVRTTSGVSAIAYADGTAVQLGSFGGNTTVYGLNEAGDAVGSSATSTGAPRAFLYTDGAFLDLTTLIPSGSGWSFLSGATGINDAGQITGWGVINGEAHAFRLDPLP
jgi:probable HAF family extracellular repeat protein